MDTNLLKSQIVLKGQNVSGISNILGISKSALYRKLKGQSEFTRTEIVKLVNLLEIEKEKAYEIFFTN